MECCICWEKYNDYKHAPWTLCCGHTFCSLCVIQVIKRGPLNCPYCRTPHTGTIQRPADLPTHHPTIDDVSEAEETEGVDSNPADGGELKVLRLRELMSVASGSGERVWACLRSEEGEPRHAQVSLWQNKLHLHALRHGHPPPPHHHTLPYKSAIELADEDASIIFLEVWWGGQVRGRVYIVLLDDEGRTRQFKALCTGSYGPSYAGTRFLEKTGVDGLEQVWAGDYENNDGSGGEALAGMQRGRKNNQPCVAGLVAGYYFAGYGQDHSPSQFAIYIKDVPGYVEMSSIGRVVSGFDLITSIANLDDIREAYVSDCGLLLTH